MNVLKPYHKILKILLLNARRNARNVVRGKRKQRSQQLLIMRNKKRTNKQIRNRRGQLQRKIWQLRMKLI